VTVEGLVLGPGGLALTGAEVVLTPAAPKGRTGAVLLVARRHFTEQDGAFRLTGMPRGGATLTVRRLGYRPVTRELVLPPPAGALTITLEQVPQQVAAVVVREKQRGPYTGWMGSFNRRRDMGFGRFITRGDIDDRNAMRTTDLLRAQVPGARFVPTPGGYAIRFRNATCDPLVWIDGTPATAGYLDIDAFPPNTLEGIEVYSGAATAPVELRGPRGEDRCGVIALWSRMPDARPRRKKAITAEDLARLIESATVYTEEQVDQRVQPDEDYPVTPVYPDSLKRRRVTGEALVEFVVDTTGRPEVETLALVSTTHPAFGRAALNAIMSANFQPALKAGRKVRQLVQLPVRFQTGS
jgi:TonB family protein